MARTTARGEVYADLTDPVAQFAHGQLQDWHDVLSQHDGVGNTDREILLHMKRKGLVLRHIQVILEHWQEAEFASNRHVETAWRPVHDRMVAAAGRQGGDASMARQWERGWTQEQEEALFCVQFLFRHQIDKWPVIAVVLHCLYPATWFSKWACLLQYHDICERYDGGTYDELRPTFDLVIACPAMNPGTASMNTHLSGFTEPSI
ncbi:MAG: hypothetical protein MMC33_002509 [Icmadophila ericetorum]|nr:hypothetical protein [Icmadophila ericetorum]